jgi:hypothetical protein
VVVTDIEAGTDANGSLGRFQGTGQLLRLGMSDAHDAQGEAGSPGCLPVAVTMQTTGRLPRGFDLEKKYIPRFAREDREFSVQTTVGGR